MNKIIIGVMIAIIVISGGILKAEENVDTNDDMYGVEYNKAYDDLMSSLLWDKEVSGEKEKELKDKLVRKYLDKEFKVKDIKCENETSLENSIECLIANLGKISETGDNLKLFSSFEEMFGSNVNIESGAKEIIDFDIKNITLYYTKDNKLIVAIGIIYSSILTSYNNEERGGDIANIYVEPKGENLYKIVVVDYQS